jgi:hypothetical protein
MDFRKSSESKNNAIKLPKINFYGGLENGAINLILAGFEFKASGMNGKFLKQKDTLFIKTVSKKLHFKIGDYSFDGFGKIDLVISKGEKLIFKNLKIYSNGLNLKGKGNINLTKRIRYSFTLKPNGNLSEAQKIFDLPFIFEGNGGGEIIIFNDKKDISNINISLFGRDGNIGNLPVHNINSFIKIKGENLDFDVKADDKIIKGKIRKDILNVDVKRVSFSDFLKLFKTELPFESMCDTNLKLNLKTNILEGKAQCKLPDKDTIDKVNFQGDLSYNYNIKSGLLKLNGNNIIGNKNDRINLNSRINFIKERYKQFNIQGEVKSLKKYLSVIKYFTELDFSTWKPEGDGKFKIDISGKFLNPKINGDFIFDDFLLQNIYIGRAKAGFILNNKITKGSFDFNGERYKGKGVFTSGKITKININVDKSDVKGINKIFELKLPIKGDLSGDFNIDILNEYEYNMEGNAKGHQFYYGAERFWDYSTNIRIKTKGIKEDALFYMDNINTIYNKGKLNGFIKFTYNKNNYKSFDIKINCNDSKLSSYYKELEGNINFSFIGKGFFGKDNIKFKGSSNNFRFISEKPFPVKLEGEIIPYQNFIFLKTNINSQDNALKSTINGEINWEKEDLSLNLKLYTNNINYILPWNYNKGEMDINANISGKWDNLQYNGIIQANGETLAIPEYSQSIDNFKIFSTINNNKIDISKISGELGGGKISGAGYISLLQGKLKDLNINLSGKNMILIPMERVKGNGDAQINMKYENQKIKIEGKITVKKMEWKREFEEGVSFSSSTDFTTERSSIIRNFYFDIQFVSTGNSWVKNSLFEGEIEYDFNIKGNYLNPVIIGEIKTKKGFINFSDQKFNILKGNLYFDNPYYINPRFDVKSEAFIKDYRVLFNIGGYYNHLLPQFTSYPPLPPQEVLTLIAMGESYKRSYSSETATMQSSSALFASTITDFLKNKTLKKLKIDMVRIYPFINSSSSEPSPRISLGKKVYKKLFVIYSMDLSSQNRYMLFAEYSLSKRISLLAFRDENGYLNFDIRFLGGNE